MISIEDVIHDIVYYVIRSDDFKYSKFAFLSEIPHEYFDDMIYDEIKRWFLHYETDIVVEFMTHGYDIAVIPIENDILFKSTRIYTIKITDAKPFSQFKYKKNK